MQHDLGRLPTHEETARAAGIDLEESLHVLDIGRTPVSLDRPIGEGEDCSFGEFVEDAHTENPLKLANNGLLREKIEDLLKTLTYREREIVRLRYGLADGYCYTLEEVGRIFKVTRERVRQIEAKAVAKLQNPVRSSELSEYVADSPEMTVEEVWGRTSRRGPRRGLVDRGKPNHPQGPDQCGRGLFLLTSGPIGLENERYNRLLVDACSRNLRIVDP